MLRCVGLARLQVPLRTKTPIDLLCRMPISPEILQPKQLVISVGDLLCAAVVTRLRSNRGSGKSAIPLHVIEATYNSADPHGEDRSTGRLAWQSSLGIR
jgi:hypothetical protein